MTPGPVAGPAPSSRCASRRVAAAACLAFTIASSAAADKPTPVHRILSIGDAGGWVDTGLTVRPQDHLTIRTGADLCFNDSEESCVRAAGWPRESYAERWPADAAACQDPFPEWSHATVVARVGEQPILVGRQTEVHGLEGRLEIAINDCSFEGDLANRGRFSVVVMVENPTAHAARGGRELIEAAIDAMGGKAIDRVRSLYAQAACTGPGGPFTTEVFTLLPAQTLFRQSSENGAAEWLATADKAWRIDRERGRRTAEKKMLPVIRGHEFHFLLFELDERFTDHTVPLPQDDGSGAEGASASPAARDDCVRVEMRDLYGAPAAVCLDPESSMPVRLSYQPAGKKKEPTIEVELESWIEIDEVQYLQAFTLRHGDDVFTYVYEELRPNAVDRAVFKAVSVRALAEIRKRAKEPPSEPAPEAVDPATEAVDPAAPVENGEAPAEPDPDGDSDGATCR